MRSQRPPPDPGAIVCDVGGLDHPDVRVVDMLASLQLIAARCGRRLRIERACPELRDLIELVGLADVLPLRVEPRGQAEQREEVLGVEEEGDPAEPVA